MTIHNPSTATQTPPRFAFRDYCTEGESFAEALLTGLAKPEKAIPCRFLYDRRGSQLFDRICELPEYYLTRTETALLTEHAGHIAKLVGPRATMLELGSGSSVKTRLLLDAFDQSECYAPIDVSRSHLIAAATAIARDYPDLCVEAICADYSASFPLPPAGRRRIAFFPGSTIGNLDRNDAITLMSMWRRRLGDDGIMIIGIDLKKDKRVLEAAYDDRQGITAAFITNILVRANRELDANFDIDAFSYEARYNELAGRVEMHLRSRHAQGVTICGRIIAIEKGERIHVENSHKYDLEECLALADAAGYEPASWYIDEDGLFSVHVWAAA